MKGSKFNYALEPPVSIATADKTIEITMSVETEERIYNLIPRVALRPAKPPRYISALNQGIEHWLCLQAQVQVSRHGQTGNSAD